MPTKSGVAHFIFDNEVEILLSIRKLMSYLPLNFMDKPYDTDFDESTLKPINELG